MRENLGVVNAPKGTRTPVAGLKSRCPRPLDDGGSATRDDIGRRPRRQLPATQRAGGARWGWKKDGASLTGRSGRQASTRSKSIRFNPVYSTPILRKLLRPKPIDQRSPAAAGA